MAAVLCVMGGGEGVVVAMEWFESLIMSLSALFASLGVAAEQQRLVALLTVYLLAVVVALVVILLVLRRRGGRSRREAEEKAPVTPAPEAVSETVETAAPVVAPPPEMSALERLRQGLARTSSSLVGRIDTLLHGAPAIDAELLEELEEVLITSDVGVQTTSEIVSALQQRLSRAELQNAAGLRRALRDEVRARLKGLALDPVAAEKPFVVMVVGVNGVGKTTTIGKLAHQWRQQGLSVLLGAGDTFRAAAADQLAIWGERAGVEVIRHAEGGDPAAVAYDAARAATARKVDVLIVDTAGRLHTKTNLMEELKKVRRVLEREVPGAPHAVLLVLDATTGQNAVSQARQFSEAVAVSGVALTKLDGTAKGGVVAAIGGELGLPVAYVGVGEQVGDLRPFDAEEFVAALFGEEMGSD